MSEKLNMKIKIKAFTLACYVELPIFVIFLLLKLGNAQGALLWDILYFYHLIPFSILSVIWLFFFGHGSPNFGPLWFWYCVFGIAAFIMQCLITMPVFVYILRKRPKQ